MLGANVTGYSLIPQTNPNLFEIADIKKYIHSVIGDIRDLSKLKVAFEKATARDSFPFGSATACA